jgi:SmpA / OmlA family
VDRREQNHAKLQGLGKDRHCRGLLGNALAVAENEIQIMTLRKISILLSLFGWLLVAVSCNRSVVTGSKLTLSNYDQITTGMTKAQVEKILGPPTTVETKDMMIFKKTTYQYEDGKKFAMFTFKNDELDSKEGNLQREP